MTSHYPKVYHPCDHSLSLEASAHKLEHSTSVTMKQEVAMKLT